ncbi:MAG: RICIN domain-containing protein [Pseudomonadota bacterium]
MKLRMHFPYLAIVSSFAVLPNVSLAQTISGSPAIASYYSHGMCLDARQSDGQILSYSCHGGWNQAFRFASGNYGMITLPNNYCLTSGSGAGPLYAARCTGSASQKWGFVSDGSLRNELGYCADIERGDRSSGARVLGWQCSGSGNQKWYPAVTSASANVGLSVASRLSANRNSIQVLVNSSGFSGGNIVAAGGGNIVAAGGGNIVAAGGGNIVAGGAGNLLSSGYSSLIGQDGASIVAAGGGNVLPRNWNFFSGNGAGIVAAGGGN